MAIVRKVGRHLLVLLAAVVTVVGGFALLIFVVGHIAPQESPSLSEPPPPRPVTYEIEVGFGPRNLSNLDLELRLDPADAASIQLPSATVSATAPASTIFQITTSEVTTDYVNVYCLVGGATVVDRAADIVEATIPAGTCLGRGSLRVPTDRDPTISAEPQTHSASGDADDRVTGVLAVNIDGCATVGGRRVAFPPQTRIDIDGTVVLPNGEELRNGSDVSVDVTDPSSLFDVAPGVPCADANDLYVVAGG